MIPDATVEEVRARADIVDIVGEYVPLKKAGKDYKACCPFHDERTPSFNVIPRKQFYHCFGCGESGDVFAFVMKRLGLDFVEAVKLVGGKVGVEVREVKVQRKEDPWQPLHEANAFARVFFQDKLREAQGGARAREYLEARGIAESAWERFGLGYAPDEWSGLRDAAAKHDIDDEVLLRVGLLNTSDKADEPYDRFRDRIIFPIEDLTGRTVAFGGRVLGKGGKGNPKYMNSPESPVFHKSQILYGLSWAKHNIRREEAVLVVEGYMDVVALAAVGIENAVAPLGTSLTEEHGQLLARYGKRVYLLFDSDAAGLRATFRAADLLLAAGLHPAVVTLPPGEDPDSLARERGADGIRSYLDDAVDVLDRKLRILEEKGYFASIEKIRSAVDKLLPTLRAASDPALRDIYVSKVAERTGVRRETLEKEMAEQREREERLGRSIPAPVREQRHEPDRRERRSQVLGRSPERDLLLVLLRDRSRLEKAAEEIGPEHFEDAANRAVFKALLDDPELDHLGDDASPQALRRFEQLMGDPEELARAQGVFRDALGALKDRPLARRAGELRDRLARAGDDGEALELARELEELEASRRNIWANWRSATRVRRAPAETVEGDDPEA